MVAIVDYGVGNLFSLKSSFAAAGIDAVVTSDKSIIRNSKKLVLPGVGAFCDAIKKMRLTGLDEVVIREVKNGKPLLGICLGMQMLFEKSYEYGEHTGLGLLTGNIRPITNAISPSLKIPHIGWNPIIIKKPSPLFNRINNGDCVYFIHSYYATDCDDVIATAEYGAELTAAVSKNNIFGCQFHPEKSGEVGINIIRAFSEDV